MTAHPYLEMELHLCNGSTHRFIQNDPDLVRQMLQQVNMKVFTRPSLVVTGHNRSAVYSGPALIGISLHMETLPEELLKLSPLPTLPREITDSEYLSGQQRLHPVAEGQPFLSVVEIEFTTGHRLRLEVSVPRAGSGLEERHILHTLLSAPGLMCRRLDGGIGLWNGAQIASCAITPELEAPSTAWPAEFVRSL